MKNGKKVQDSSQKEKSKQHDYLAKILVIGDGGVGKTSLITRFTQQSFSLSYTATIGVDFKSKIVQYNSKSVKLQIWDTAGQQRFRNITQAYYRGASGILLSFSLNDKASFDNIEKWLQQIEESAPKECCKMLVGTKKDCEENRVISYETAEKLAIKVGIKYMETSAKSGQNVYDAFFELGRQIYETSLRKIKKVNDNIKVQAKIFEESNQKKSCSC